MARPSSQEMIARLVAFDTVSRNSNLALIDFVRAHLAPLEPRIRLTHDDDGCKANLLATLGPVGGGGYILSGHTDVVPADAADWTTNPFRLTERDGRLYGRGAVDMKGFLGVVLACVPRFADRLTVPLHLALSYDEELGCVGVRRLIADLRAAGLDPGGCVVGEPTGMGVVVAHKGKETWRVRVRGRAAHASEAPRHPSAVEGAARLATRLYDLSREFARSPQHASGFDLPFTTINVGVIEGGTAVNVVAAEAAFEMELRFLPGFDPALVIDDAGRFAREVLPDHDITFERIAGYPGLDQPEESAIVAFARRLGGGPGISRVAFGTEAGLYQSAGIPTVVCGPGLIDQAHTRDEYVSLQQVAACEAFVERMMGDLCGP